MGGPQHAKMKVVRRSGRGDGCVFVPALGGIAAIGIGLCELFHCCHSSTPKPPPAPMQSVSSKGELVTPSFDSVTDTPASQAAF